MAHGYTIILVRVYALCGGAEENEVRIFCLNEAFAALLSFFDTT